MRSGGSRSTFLDWLAWLVVAGVALVALTQVTQWSGRVAAVPVAQSLTPYLGLLLVPVVLLASWRRRYTLTTVATAVGIVVLILAGPLVLPGDQPRAVADAVGLRVASTNLWYQNDRVADAADVLLEIDADVVVFNEYTRDHQETLQSTRLSTVYPFHVDHVGYGASGIAVWSKYRVEVDDSPSTQMESVELTVAGPDGDVRIVAMHIPTPVSDFAAWRADLAIAAQIGRSADGPTLLIGDLNASYWHPDFRRLLDAGFVDAHMAAGKGFSTSWPTTWVVPPFVRLDHALATGGLVSTDVDDFDVPGSDHRGLVVSVAPTR